MARPVEGAELGQLGDKSAGDDGADTGHGGEEVLLLAPGRRAPHGSVDVAVEAVEFAGKRLQELSMLLRTRSGAPARRWRSGGHHGDDLAAVARRARRAGGSPRPGAAGSPGAVASMKCAITAASMASVFARLPSRAGKGADLGRVDDDDGQAGLGEARDHDGLEASGRLKPDRLGSHGAQPHRPARRCSSVSRGTIEAVVRATNVHVEAILGNVDTDEWGRWRPLFSRPCASGLRWRPKRLFGFNGTASVGPCSPTGLGVPEGRRPHASPPPPALYQCRCDESYKGRGGLFSSVDGGLRPSSRGRSILMRPSPPTPLHGGIGEYRRGLHAGRAPLPFPPLIPPPHPPRHPGARRWRRYRPR